MGNLLYDIPFIPFVLLMIAMLVASVINLKKLKQAEPQKRPWCSMMYVTMLGVPVFTVARCLHDLPIVISITQGFTSIPKAKS